MKFISLIGHDVEFNQEIEEFEIYIETGMRATIYNVEKYPESGLYKIIFDFSKFENHNKNLESFKFFYLGRRCTYRDRYGYKAIDEFCVSNAVNCFMPIPNRLRFDNGLRLM